MYFDSHYLIPCTIFILIMYTRINCRIMGYFMMRPRMFWTPNTSHIEDLSRKIWTSMLQLFFKEELWVGSLEQLNCRFLFTISYPSVFYLHAVCLKLMLHNLDHKVWNLFKRMSWLKENYFIAFVKYWNIWKPHYYFCVINLRIDVELGDTRSVAEALARRKQGRSSFLILTNRNTAYFPIDLMMSRLIDVKYICSWIVWWNIK